MKIGVNACNYNERPSGAKSRFIGLYRNLFAQAKKLDFVVFEPKDAVVRNWFPSFANVSFVKTGLDSVSTLKRSFRGLSFWGKALRQNSISAFETSYLPAVIHPKGETILTIYDLRYLKFPELYSPLRNLFSRSVYKKAFKHSNCIVTISETMKEEILEFDSKAKVHVISPGLPIEYESLHVDENEIEAVRRRFQLSHDFILTVGHLEKRKNLERLFRAYEILLAKGLDIPLIVIGNPSDAAEDLYRFVKDRPRLLDKIVFLRGISDRELCIFYRLASLFVFPSLYEGFGVPLVESMFWNTPYVTSDISVFKEITANRGVYFDPFDVEDMADKMELVLASSEERKRLNRLSAERLPLYTYPEIARRYGQLLSDLV